MLDRKGHGYTATTLGVDGVTVHTEKLVAAAVLRRLLAQVRLEQEVERRVWRALIRLARIIALLAAVGMGIAILIEGGAQFERRFGPKRVSVQAFTLYPLPGMSFAQAYVPTAEARLYRESVAVKLEEIARTGAAGLPAGERQGGMAGVFLRIARDGSLNRAILIRSSGDRTLDDAACRLVRAAAPFAPLPGQAGDRDGVRIARWIVFAGTNGEDPLPPAYSRDAANSWAGTYECAR